MNGKLMLSTGLSLALLCASSPSAMAGSSELAIPIPFHPSNSSCRDFLRRNHITDIRDCDISETGNFGTISDRTFYYVIYCIIPAYSSEPGKCGDESFPGRYYRKRGIGIFVQEGAEKHTRLFLERGDPDIGMYLYQNPAIVKNTFGTFLHVPIGVDGTGNFNESEYYIWDSKSATWKMLDTTSWISELSERLPAGLTINKGIWPDIDAMIAETSLYKENDGNCCPTGGTAVVKLTLEDLRFRIQSVKFKKYVEQ
ncbi:hypothetical protein [Geomonas ferrireducens]|uniref:hypothetical protein n=1 Tax=Geomonas ferrireducens TaxID=2570227 RepID=UPI0010A91A1C|nr:hypothetical protein [Geomonas ferrireducens]